METSLHRHLKQHYAGKNARQEVPLGNYRIDVVENEHLIEIQHGSLSAIRDKVADLLRTHQVTVVKPIVLCKKLVKQDAKGGNVVSQRFSPKRGSVWDVFDELIYFTRVFPHRNLRLEVPLVDVEEWRFPGHGRRRRRRKNDHQVEDCKLVNVQHTLTLETNDDLRQLMPPELPQPFDTGQLAEQIGVSRRIAQRIAYCFRKMGTTRQVGKRGNAITYEWACGIPQ